ncbi:hypothetical protein BV22DRAFT_1040801 [Leucogyrophana mollusca]|uniref:Uncharacterized protein n=1 Tax=Leucogyrophana mollusca TaxID=85980 RepID=A0ACB8B1I3_9AGAM|nr:hypothetical protein BV22DRAFT_1040801 [Leucogyrophana mollusca]
MGQENPIYTLVMQEMQPMIPGPITFLPADALLHIFHIGVHDPTDDTFNGADFAVLVSHICRAWRDLAVNTPTLWTSLAIGMQPGGLPHTSPTLRRAAAFVLRAQNLPLSVTLDLRSVSGLSPALMQALETPALSLAASIAMDFILPLVTYRLLAHPMPLLEHWEVEQADAHRSFITATSPAQVQPIADPGSSTRLPRLRTMTLTGVHANWGHWSISNLTSLTIEYLGSGDRPTFGSLRAILLRNAHSLRELQIQGAIPLRSDSWSPRIPSAQEDLLPLSHLRSLILGYTHPLDALSFLHALHLPRLKSLTLRDIARVMEGEHYPTYAGAGMPVAFDGNSFHSQFDASFLVDTMCKHLTLPLAQIEHLELAHVTFQPPSEPGRPGN